LAFCLVFSFALPGHRHNESDAIMQTTFYVGLGQARAAPVTLDARATQDVPAGQDVAASGGGAIGAPAAAGQSQRHVKAPGDESAASYLSPDQLDIGAMPVSEPEYSLLNGLPNSHQPIRLRLFIDARGNPADVKVLQADDRDGDSVTRVCAMFFIARFLPGRLNRKDMPSYLDIEFNIDDTMRIPPTRSS
jgi:hypothetical protein